MKAMKLTGLRQMEMKNVPDPQINDPKEVLIKMLVLGICGSDIHYYTEGRIGSQIVKYPFTVGHEGAGVVVKTGSNVTRVVPGDIIAIEPSLPCGSCDQCLTGRPHTCRNTRFLGCPEQTEGSLSEYLVMPEDNCIPVPAGLSPDHGSISEPLSIGIYSVKKSGGVRGMKIAILGFGPIGMSVMLAAKAYGADKIYVTDKIEERLAIARNENAFWTGNPIKDDIVVAIGQQEPLGIDTVFECCGQQEAFDQAVDILKPGGKLIIAGIPEFDRWSMCADTIRRREIMIQFIRRQTGCTEEAIEMMKSGRIDITNMVTHRFPFNRSNEAFEFVAGYRDGVMKALIDF